MNTYEYPINKDEFDKYASEMPVVNSVTFKEDGYKLYGDGGLASTVKFKMTDKGEISVIIMEPEKVLCYTCEVEYKTEKHTKGCPVCGTTTRAILNTNRCFQDEWNTHQIQVDREYKAQLVKDQANMMAKHGLIKAEELEGEIERLLSIHVPE